MSPHSLRLVSILWNVWLVLHANQPAPKEHLVGKGSLTSFSCDPSTSGFALTTEHVLDHDGNPMTEFDGQGNWRRTGIRAGGELIASYDNSGTHFQLNAWLGTRRVQTDVAGNPEIWYPGSAYGDLVTPESSSSSAANATNKVLHRQRTG